MASAPGVLAHRLACSSPCVNSRLALRHFRFSTVTEEKEASCRDEFVTSVASFTASVLFEAFKPNTVLKNRLEAVSCVFLYTQVLQEATSDGECLSNIREFLRACVVYRLEVRNIALLYMLNSGASCRILVSLNDYFFALEPPFFKHTNQNL